MRVIFNQDHQYQFRGLGRFYMKGMMEDFVDEIAKEKIDDGIADLAPKELQEICVLKYNSKLKLIHTLKT